MRKKLLFIFALAVLILPMTLALFGGLGTVAAAPPYKYEPGNGGVEIPALRTATSKTYDLGNGIYRIISSGDTIHWRENVRNEDEPWKDIDLTWEHLPGGVRQITKAPYILTQDGDLVTFTDRRTSEVSTIELISVHPSAPYEIIPFADGFSYQCRVTNLNTPFRAQYRVIGNINATLVTRAFDDLGEFELRTTYEGNILTETLSAPMDKITGRERATQGYIRIDPTATVQPATKDTRLNGASAVGKTTNYGTSVNLVMGCDKTTVPNHAYSIPLVHFTLPADPGGTIDTIQVYLYKWFDLAGYTCPAGEVHELSRTDWVETEATWYSYKAAANWTNEGGDYDATIIDTTNDLKTFGNYGWEYFNIQGAGADNPLALGWTDDVHLLFKYPEDNDFYYLHWYSSDYAGDVSLRPKLVIEYTPSAAPTTSDPTLQTASKAMLEGIGQDAVTGTVGFVWDTVPRANPGNLAPGATAYSDSWTSGAGVYQNTPFEYRATGLDYFIASSYYYRAAGLSAGVWSYGDEVNMTAFVDIWDSGAIVTQTPGGPGTTGRNCIVADDYLYAVEQSYRNLVIYDVSDPVTPVFQSLTDLDWSGACDLEKKGDYLILTMLGYSDISPTGITVWDVSDPTEPLLVKTLHLCSNGVHGLYLDGDVLYVTAWDGYTVYSIDVTYPASATLLDSVSSPTYLPGPHDVYVQGNYAYVASWDAGASSYGLGVINVANPSNMAIVGGAGLNWKGSHITGDGSDYVYVGSHQPSAGLKVFDISTPSSPVEVDHYAAANPSQGYWNDWYTSYLVSIDSPTNEIGIHVVNVTDPTDLTLIAIREDDITTTSRGNVFVENGYLYLPHRSLGTYWEWHVESVELILLKARTVTSAATSVTATTARLNSLVDDAGEVSCDVQFRYKRTTDSTWIETAWQADKVTDDTPYVDLEDLEASTVYHFQVRPRNSVGEWPWSDSLGFTTGTLSSPTIETEAASRIAFTSARLNSVLVDDGGLDCTIRFGWGNTTQSAIEDYDFFETLPGTYTQDQHPYLDVTGLNATMGNTFYFSVEAENDNGTDLGAELSFTTTSLSGTVQNFRGVSSDDHISLSWDVLPGATNYLIRYRADDYPTGVDDGTQVYFSSGTSTVHSNLEAGTPYYYMIWGESGEAYSSNTTLLMSTTAGPGAGASVSYTSPTEIPRWLGGSDYTNVAGLGFVYTLVNNAADSLSMPRGNFWFFTWMAISVAAGLGVFIKSNGKLMVAAVVMTIIQVIGWMMMLVPFWAPFVGGVLILASFAGHREVAARG